MRILPIKRFAAFISQFCLVTPSELIIYFRLKNQLLIIHKSAGKELLLCANIDNVYTSACINAVINCIGIHLLGILRFYALISRDRVRFLSLYLYDKSAGS